MLVKLPLFTESPACKRRRHCHACRNDRGWRESLAKGFSIPSADFECPHGVPWGFENKGILHGVAGVFKAVTGIDRATPEEIDSRKSICEACEHISLLAGVMDRCALCGCPVRLKVLVSGEKCPAGKW